MPDFHIGQDGLIDYPTPSDAFMQGRGRSTLQVVGRPVELDARDLQSSCALFSLVGVTSWLEAAKLHVVNLLPRRYGFGQPNGPAAGVFFEIDEQGAVTVSKGGFVTAGLNDAGQTRVSFVGLAVTLDATAMAASIEFFSLPALTNWLPAAEPRVLNLMPNHYLFGQPNGEVPAAWFDLAADGSLAVAAGGFITADTDADGHARINFIGLPVTLDATAMAASNEFFSLPALTNWLPAAEPRVLNLMPNHYLFGQPNGEVPAAWFDLAADGSLAVAAGGFITADTDADGHARINFIGLPVTSTPPRWPPATWFIASRHWLTGCRPPHRMC